MLKEIFYNTFVETERKRDEYAATHKAFDTKAMWVCIATAFSLSMIYYIGRYSYLKDFLNNSGAGRLIETTDSWVRGGNSSNLGELTYWVTMLVIFYFIVPVAVIRLVFKERLDDYGLQWKGAFKDYYLYIIMLMVMVPLVVYFSGTKVFQAKYPFLDIRSGQSLFPDFWKWELLYCAQFFALEFFFRGFVLHGLKSRLGFYSVFVMTIPYCMIHFGKPLQETLAAIIAGIVLGTLSLKSRSIFLGCLIHMTVGLGMDFAALWQKGFFD
ncbi:MAG: CPBP family intramembrane glutamic endopeptidase [Bacteroidia bacterium]|jgi:membrane protease YdiL (CAAX protease family)